MSTITDTSPTEQGAVPTTAGTPLTTDTLRRLADLDARHDRSGAYVAESVELLRSNGWLALPVPAELGGAGGTIAEVGAAQRTLARHAPNAALVTSMHHHVVLATAWRWRRGAAPAEAMLRRVAEEGLFVASTGGNDFLAPNGEATPTEGGYRVSGRKRFVSGALSAGVINTFVLDAASGGTEALGMAIPVSAEGVRIEETWDALGMRGTGSHDVVLEDVFVPEAAVAVRRPLGVVHPSIQAIAAHAFPVILSVYLGVAEGGRDAAVAALADRPGAAEDPGTLRSVGRIEAHLGAATRVLGSLIAELGDDVQPSEEQFVSIMLAKHTVTEEVRAAAEAMMDAVGGAAYSRRLPVERAWRDLRAAPFHPLSAEQTLRTAGASALGSPLL